MEVRGAPLNWSYSCIWNVALAIKEDEKDITTNSGVCLDSEYDPNFIKKSSRKLSSIKTYGD